MDKYRLVEEHRIENESFEEEGSWPGRTTQQGFPEVRITQQGKPRNFIAYSMSLFVSFRQRESMILTTFFEGQSEWYDCVEGHGQGHQQSGYNC